MSGSTLALLSFTAESRALDPSSGRPLMIDWPAPPAAREVQLRALSMRRRLFYRMDTRVPASNTRYVWPTEVLSAMDLKRAEIGLLGWTRSMVGGIAQDVFLPLTASQGRPAASTHLYTFVVRPGAELSEVFLTVTRLAADGGVSRAQQPARELGYGYYPAENPIEITIDAPAEQGLYAVHLGAKLRSGGASTLQFVFQAPGR